jgi:hypothetical protein
MKGPQATPVKEPGEPVTMATPASQKAPLIVTAALEGVVASAVNVNQIVLTVEGGGPGGDGQASPAWRSKFSIVASLVSTETDSPNAIVCALAKLSLVGAAASAGTAPAAESSAVRKATTRVRPNRRDTLAPFAVHQHPGARRYRMKGSAMEEVGQARQWCGGV